MIYDKRGHLNRHAKRKIRVIVRCLNSTFFHLLLQSFFSILLNMNLFVILLVLCVGATRFEDGRVDIGGNCKAIISGTKLTPEAKDVEQSVMALRKTNLDHVCLYSSLDSILTLASSSPEERSLLVKHCQGKWVPGKDEVELCFISTKSFDKMTVPKTDAEGMSASGLMGASAVKAFKINTKTVESQECFKRVASRSIQLPPFREETVKQAQEQKVAVESIVYKEVKNAKNPSPVMIVAKRPKGTESNPNTNLNLEVSAVFPSPNDGEFPTHHLPIAGLLSTKVLDEILRKPDIGLAYLLENFGLQAIIVNDKSVDKDVINQIRSSTAKTGGSRIGKDVTLDDFEPYPQ